MNFTELSSAFANEAWNILVTNLRQLGTSGTCQELFVNDQHESQRELVLQSLLFQILQLKNNAILCLVFTLGQGAYITF